MTSQPAYDRYNARYDNAVYLAATDGMTLDEAIALQDTALRLCEWPASPMAEWIKAQENDDTITMFLALFV